MAVMRMYNKDIVEAGKKCWGKAYRDKSINVNLFTSFPSPDSPLLGGGGEDKAPNPKWTAQDGSKRIK